MGVHVTGVDESRLEEMFDVAGLAFGEALEDVQREDERERVEIERMLIGEDDGRVVATAGAYSFTMTVPGGDMLPVAAVTWVTVLPTHRRQGVLTTIMRRQLDDVAERREPIAVLTASEAAIYGRFGYGLATRLAKSRLRTDGGMPLLVPPACGGRLRIVPSEEAAPHIPRVYADTARTRPGEVVPREQWWTVMHRDREQDRDGATPRHWVLHESTSGEVDGYAAWRVKKVDGGDAVQRSDVRLEELAAVDPEVEAALLSFLCELDLTASVSTWVRPVDDPFRLRIADDRRYRVELIHDHLYVRLLDIPVALSARTYEWADERAVVLGVDDPFRQQSSGRYRLADGACERIGDLHDGDADVFLPVEALGSLYLGDVTARQLAAAGRLKPSSPASLDAVDRTFRTPTAPFCTREF